MTITDAGRAGLDDSANDRAALVIAGPRLQTQIVTTAELGQLVADRRREFDRNGGRRLVLVAGGNQLDVVVSYLAARAGGHPVVLAESATGSVVDRYRPDLIVSADAAGCTVERRQAAPAHVLHPDLALLLSTSGSTGSPKLVRLSHRNLDANARAIAEYQHLRPDDCGITSLPLHYCYGLSVLNAHLAVGAPVVLSDLSVVDGCFWQAMQRHGVTNLAGVPHTFDLIERVGTERLKLDRLRLVTQAGGRMSPVDVVRWAETGRRFGWDFMVMYGQTEATARMGYLPAELVTDFPDRVGIAIPGGSFEIRPCPDVSAEDDASAGVGEVVYRGPNVMMGYAEDPADLARPPELDELATGDLGRIDEHGLLQLVGRRNRFAKLFGLRIDLGGVEGALAEHGVVAVCASDDSRLVVAVQGRPPRQCAELLARLTSLPARAVHVVAVDSIPRLSSGKPDAKAVLALARRESTIGQPICVAALFAELLDLERVGSDDSFASLGGDSFSYVEASIRLEQMLGFVPETWHLKSVAELDQLQPRDRRRWVARIETSVALRAMAITTIVVTHMRIARVPAGAHILLAVVGFNFARFQLPRLLAASGAGDYARRALGPLGRLAAITSAWIGVQMLVSGGHSLATLLLVNDYVGAPEHLDARWRYWFFEAIIQISLVVVAVLAVPRIRRFASEQGFWFPMVLLVPASVLRFEVVRLVDRDFNYVYRPDTIIWCFLLGWAAAVARTWRQRLLVSLAAAVLVIGYFRGNPDRELRLLGAVLLLAWVSTVVVPRVLARPIGWLASASMWIFMTHWLVWPALTPELPQALALVLTLAAGVGAWAAWGRLVNSWRTHTEPFRLTERFRMVEHPRLCQNPPG